MAPLLHSYVLQYVIHTVLWKMNSAKVYKSSLVFFFFESGKRSKMQ